MKRVKKSAADVWARYSGANWEPLKKSRVWSRAISAITAPRRKSTQAGRESRLFALGTRKSSWMTTLPSAGALDFSITACPLMHAPFLVSPAPSRTTISGGFPLRRRLSAVDAKPCFHTLVLQPLVLHPWTSCEGRRSAPLQLPAAVERSQIERSRGQQAECKP